MRLQLDGGRVLGNRKVPHLGVRAQRADSKRGLAGEHGFPRGSEPKARDVEVEG